MSGDSQRKGSGDVDLSKFAQPHKKRQLGADVGISLNPPAEQGASKKTKPLMPPVEESGAKKKAPTLLAPIIHPSPVGKQTVPFGRPSHGQGEGMGSKSSISQPVMAIQGAASKRPQKYAPGEHHADQLADRLGELRDKSIATAQTMSVSLPKHDTRTATLKKSAESKGLSLTGANMSGFYDPQNAGSIPSYVDYTGHRSKQVLSQLSEIMMHSARQDQIDPVEIQFGYGKRESGDVDLFASANQASVQNWLAEAMTKPMGFHLERASKSDNEELRMMADKLLFHQSQTEGRREAIGSPTEAQRADLTTADTLVGSFLQRNVTVVKNQEAQAEYDRRVTGKLKITKANQTARHAEQNIATAIHTRNKDSMDPYHVADVQGSKIRCEGCSSEIAHDMTEGSKALMGKAYPTQANTARHEHSMSMVAEKQVRFGTGSQRPRALSNPRLPKYVPKKIEEE